MKKRGPGRPRKHPLPSPPPSPPPVVEVAQPRHRDRGADRGGGTGGRGWEGDTVTDAIESVVQDQRRKGQKRKRWDRDGDEEEEDEEEDGEAEEPEERLVDREENLGNLGMRPRAGGGRGWLTQDELQRFRG